MDSLQPWLIVGLGNPGTEYENTRHNVGYLGADELARRDSARFGRHRRGLAQAADVRLAGARAVVMKPLSYMNESGGPVSAIMAFHKIPLTSIVVIHDELDIAFDTLRCKFGGGDNGHNGLKSIRRSCGSGDFLRVRVGIGRPPGRQEPADFVLKPWSSTERKDLPLLVDRAADAVESLVSDGLEITQQRFNS